MNSENHTSRKLGIIDLETTSSPGDKPGIYQLTYRYTHGEQEVLFEAWQLVREGIVEKVKNSDGIFSQLPEDDMHLLFNPHIYRENNTADAFHGGTSIKIAFRSYSEICYLLPEEMWPNDKMIAAFTTVSDKPVKQFPLQVEYEVAARGVIDAVLDDLYVEANKVVGQNVIRANEKWRGSLVSFATVDDVEKMLRATGKNREHSFWNGKNSERNLPSR